MLPQDRRPFLPLIARSLPCARRRPLLHARWSIDRAIANNSLCVLRAIRLAALAIDLRCCCGLPISYLCEPWQSGYVARNLRSPERRNCLSHNGTAGQTGCLPDRRPQVRILPGEPSVLGFGLFSLGGRRDREELPDAQARPAGPTGLPPHTRVDRLQDYDGAGDKGGSPPVASPPLGQNPARWHQLNVTRDIWR